MPKNRSAARCLSHAIFTGIACLPAVALSQDIEPPAGVTVIDAPEPREISGVAALPAAYGGFAVVGDEDHKSGRIWPSGAKWKPSKKSSSGKRAKGLEAVDVGIGPDGQEFWLVLGENNRTLSTKDGRNFKLDKAYKEVCGRGPEGLSVRWHQDRWQIAVLWEGGYYKKKDCKDGLPSKKHARPKVIMFDWKPNKKRPEFVADFDLKVVKNPSGDQIFRAPDLAWMPGQDALLVLLASSAKGGKQPHKHTWLQVFGMDGQPMPGHRPVKLEQQWGAFESLNWEALDFTLDGTQLIMGNDAKAGQQMLALFPTPF